MTYTLNDSATGPYSKKEFAKKGDVVTLIAEHGNMAIVEKGKVRFPVRIEKLDKKVTNPKNNIQSLF